MKKKSTILASLALAGVLFTGGTFAYLQSTTNEVENIFTMGEGVSAEVTEPGWDLTGKEDAKNFYPGLVIAKDPKVTNKSENTSVYAAVTINYTNQAGDAKYTYDQLAKFLDIDFNTTDWDFNDSKTVAYYKGELTGKTTTSSVFSTVTIKDTATHPSQGDADTAMNDFNITVQGYVCQTEEVGNATTAKEALNIVFPTLNVQ